MAEVFARGRKTGRKYRHVTEPVATLQPGGLAIFETEHRYYIDDREVTLEELKREMTRDGIPKSSPKDKKPKKKLRKGR